MLHEVLRIIDNVISVIVSTENTHIIGNKL